MTSESFPIWKKERGARQGNVKKEENKSTTKMKITNKTQ